MSLKGSMKVVILTIDQPNQAALCRKLEPHCEIAAIVLSENVPRKSPPVARRMRSLINRASTRVAGRPFIHAWQQLQRSYQESYGDLPAAPIVRVKNVNDAATIRAIEKVSPDLIIVSGTNLVGRKVLEMSSRGIGAVNLHTGLSPYIKGGPNCTNWCLAERSFHLIGNTVMWLDPGIDSGNIIASEQTRLTGQETLAELHWEVMEHAQAMYVTVIGKLARGESVPSVAQDSIGTGKTFYSIDWNLRAMLNARHNFENHYRLFFTNAEGRLAHTSRLTLLPILEA
jgi:methionyl-tRNA formyltransferase